MRGLGVGHGRRRPVPGVAAKAGHYESFYLKAGRPGGGQALWIRHTVHKRPGAEPNASIWFVLFDREAEGPRATKVTVPAAELSAPGRRLDPGRRRRDRAGPRRGRGRDRRPARLLGARPSRATPTPCKYLPADWLYEAPLPKTKFVAPYPERALLRHASRSTATDPIELDGWPGMIGHNWGTEHAERWVWLEGTGFEDAPGAYFDAGAARIKVGPWTTPVGALGDAGPRRRAAPARRLRQDPLGDDRGLPDRLLLRPARRGRRRPRPRLRADRRTSSAGSTPTPTAPSTTRSTAPPPTSS